jgi:acetolactate synthase-1/2/3 large subunit
VSNELVVFLHAVGGDASMWAPQLDALAASRRWKTIALDLARPAARVSMAAFADDVAQAIARAGYARAHLVGLSMGGVVALETFRRHRGVVRSLTLANSWAWMPDGEARRAWVRGMLATKTVAEFSRESMPPLFAAGTSRELVERMVAIESGKDKDAYLAAWERMLSADLRPVLDGIDVPVLLIGGSEDKVTPTVPLLMTIRDAVPTARLVELAGAAHFSNLDRPDAWNATLTGFLRDAGGGDDRAAAPAAGDDVTLPAGSAADRLMRLLWLRGVEALYANSGTDFTPIIDALAGIAAERGPAQAPRVVAAAHENTTIAMAHGHALMTRRPQAVMAHVHVGTANAGLGIINARRARVPALVMAGRTPWFEDGLPGVRTNFVQWGQESYDQAGSFREFTKWDYELRTPHALDTVVERALAIAASEPMGPVYLTLPREPLMMTTAAATVPAVARQRPERPSVPDDASLDAAAAWIAAAERPLVVTADLGRAMGGPEALVRFARAAGAGVVEHGKRNFFNFPTEEPHHLGFEPMPHVGEADVVIAVECPVPWIPALAKLPRAPKVVQVGVDPLFQDLPLRGFPSDLTLAGDPAATLRALTRRLVEAAEREPATSAARLARRTDTLGERHAQLFGAARAAARADGDAGRAAITKRFASWCVGQAIDDDVVIFNEYDLDPWLVPRRVPSSWFENSVASGLGWSLGAALGAKVAAPERTMVVTLGDGSFLFNTPLAALHAAACERLPVLIVVFNDTAWSIVKQSVRGAHPAGAAVKSGSFPLTEFSRSVDFARVAEATGAVGVRVERPGELLGRLRDAIERVREGDRAVVVDVICERDG